MRVGQSSCLTVVSEGGKCGSVEESLFPHVKNVISRDDILHPDISITLVAAAHFLNRYAARGREHPARRCLGDMTALV